MNNLLKKAIAEVIGTFVLVFVACGVAAATGGELVATSLAFGLVIVAMAYAVGRISGCHINPAVSIGVLLAGKMTVKEFVVYIVSQILGAVLGAVAIFGIAKMSGVTLLGDACNYACGSGATTATYPKAGAIFGALLIEIILTCIFVYVILNVTDENGTAGKKAGLLIGLTLTLVHLLGINFTGTSVNPARSIGTAFGALIFNGTSEAFAEVWMFIVAPLIGGVLAALLYKVLHTSKKEETK